jgi:thiosulfate/3-mercaptopyruvate sulfurtransferase
MGLPSPLISADDLAAMVAGPRPPHLLDVRWSLARPDGRPAYLAGHLPGATYVDLETELAAPPAPGSGRHPLPAPATLLEALRRHGLRAGATVVAYDDAGGLAAARAWWVLRWAGLPDVRVLDGGLGAWLATGRALTGDVPEPAASDLTIVPGAMAVLTADDAAALATPNGNGSGVLLDARASERYRGEVEPIDPVAGHIPGAVSAPTTGNLRPDGRFLGPAALRARFAALGADGSRPIGVYCGSGVTAAHTVLALAAADPASEASLYPGSWSAWVTDPARPVAVGDG